jgi:hypothetical protein
VLPAPPQSCGQVVSSPGEQVASPQTPVHSLQSSGHVVQVSGATQEPSPQTPSQFVVQSLGQLAQVSPGSHMLLPQEPPELLLAWLVDEALDEEDAEVEALDDVVLPPPSPPEPPSPLPDVVVLEPPEPGPVSEPEAHATSALPRASEATMDTMGRRWMFVTASSQGLGLPIFASNPARTQGAPDGRSVRAVLPDDARRPAREEFPLARPLARPDASCRKTPRSPRLK